MVDYSITFTNNKCVIIYDYKREDYNYYFTLLYFIPLYLELFSNFVKYNFFPWIHQTSMIWNYLTDDLISFGLCLILLGFIIIGVEKVVERLL